MKVYLDAVSTTNIHPEVLKTYKDLLDKYYCNSDALYDDSVAIYDMQEKSRKIILDLMGLKKDELIFTAGASEANSLAIKGYALNNPDKKHLITSIYEHSSVNNSFKQLEEKFGYEVTYLVPDKNGQITPQMVASALKDNTGLVSIMMVNNEIGVVNDIDGIAKVVKKHSGTLFHVDITQALGKVNVDLSNVDMASFSAHKLHGIKGSGGLFKKAHIELLPLISGGQQEYSMRGGTSNAVANIVLAKTFRLALESMKEHEKQIDTFYNYLKDNLKDVVKFNSNEYCLKSLINMSTPLTSEVMLNALNKKGIMVSSKSTCGSKKNEPNRTLSALGIDDNHAIRVSYDYTNTMEEIEYFVSSLKEIISKYG